METQLPKLHPLTPQVLTVTHDLPKEPAGPGLHYYVNSKVEWTVDDVRLVLSNILVMNDDDPRFAGAHTGAALSMDKARHVQYIRDVDLDRLYELGYIPIMRRYGIGGAVIWGDCLIRPSPDTYNMKIGNAYAVLKLMKDFADYLRREKDRNRKYGKPPVEITALNAIAVVNYLVSDMVARRSPLVSLDFCQSQDYVLLPFTFEPRFASNKIFEFAWPNKAHDVWMTNPDLDQLIQIMMGIWPSFFEAATNPVMIRAKFDSQLTLVMSNVTASLETLIEWSANG
jgi:hypothetical protein